MLNPGTSSSFRLHTLQHTYRHLQNHLEASPIKADLLDAQVNVNAWPHVVSAYELLELSLKALVNVLDLNYTEKEMKSDGHNLSNVFRSLESADSSSEAIQRIEKGYHTYVSLHNTFPYRLLSDFIQAIKSDYTLWRYYPLVGWGSKSPSRISPHAMLELIFHINGIIAKHVAMDHGLATVTNRLSFCLKNCLIKHLTEFCVRLPTGHGLIDKANRWVNGNTGFLNGIALHIFREKRNEPGNLHADLNPMLLSSIESTIQDTRSADNRQFSYVGAHNVRAFYNRAAYDENPLKVDESGFFTNI